MVVAAGEPTAQLDERRLVELIVGRSVTKGGAGVAGSGGRPVLEAELVSGITLRGVSLKVHRGEILGVAGLVGSGRTELARTVFDAVKRELERRDEGPTELRPYA